MVPSASIPAVRQNLSKLTETASQALSTAPIPVGGKAVNGVIAFFMALLSFRGISTPSLPAQGEQRRSSYFNIPRGNSVMTWNLAFDHLLNWILKDPVRLMAFNAAIPTKFQKSPKKASIVISRYDDFADDLKEFEIIELCKSADLLNDNLIRTLKEKLGKRNTAAHPSTMVVGQSQADDVVTDLVNNVVLALT
jgi:hypothetical protein